VVIGKLVFGACTGLATGLLGVVTEMGFPTGLLGVVPEIGFDGRISWVGDPPLGSSWVGAPS
jgi:hypothetical protein